MFVYSRKYSENNQENKDVLNLTLNHLEGLANEEIEGDEMKKATAYVCYFTKRYYDENTNSIIEKSVEGRVGICDGEAGHIIRNRILQLYERDSVKTSGYKIERKIRSYELENNGKRLSSLLEVFDTDGNIYT